MSETKPIDVDDLLANMAAERKRAERAEDWHSLVSQQKAELEKTSAQLLARAEKAEAAVVAVADAAQHQRIRADKAEADVLRERQETYRVQQERDAARKAFDQRRADCDRLRSCTHCAVAADYDAACELLYGSGYGQLAARLRDLIAQRDRLRAERDDMERRLAESIQWNQTATQYAARISCLERQLAERPTMGALKAAAVAWLRDYQSDEVRTVDVWELEKFLRVTDSNARKHFAKHFAPLAADGNAPKSSKSPEGPPAASAEWVERCIGMMADELTNQKCSCTAAIMRDTETHVNQAIRAALARIGLPKCERCGNSLARLCPQCDAAATFDGLQAKGPPTDLSAACVSDEDIRRGEERT